MGGSEGRRGEERRKIGKGEDERRGKVKEYGKDS